MYKDNRFYCVHPDWQQNYANDYGAKLIKNKIIQASEDFGEGYTFFSQVIPGIALLLMDFTTKSPIKVQSIKEEVYRYIIHYDLSEETNYLIINNKRNKIGYNNSNRIVLLDNQMESYFEPSVGTKTFALRLFVDEKLMSDFLEKIFITKNNLKQKLTSDEKTVFFDEIDANSILLMTSIKERSVFQESFNPFIKGIGLKLLGVFFKKHSQIFTAQNSLNKGELERLIITKNYLLNNLNNKFPSITFLSKIAGMSPTKFKILFRTQFNSTCKKMFILEKMNLAREMLQSGHYQTITEVAYEMNYNKVEMFSSQYFDLFNKRPLEDFIKK